MSLEVALDTILPHNDKRILLRYGNKTITNHAGFQVHLINFNHF